MQACPPEIWLDIFWLACTDTGFTGRSISLTSRFFYELSKPVKLRSVGLRGVVQIIDFLNLIERTPVVHRRVENLFVSTDIGCDSPEDVLSDAMEALVNLYEPGYDIRVHHPSSVEEIVNDYAELKFHAVTRILSAVAPTLKYLHIVFAPSREFILPHVNLPQLVDLVIQGSYEDWVQLRPGAAPTFKKLRRLRLTEVSTSGGDTFKTIAASAPNLTHLRLDYRNPYYYTLCSELKEFLGDASQKPDTTRSKFPVSLEKLFLHPGMRSPPGSYMCGTGFMVQFSSMKALRTLADTDPRFILLKEDEYTRRSNHEVDEGLTAWLGEINGQPSHWEEPSKNFHMNMDCFE